MIPKGASGKDAELPINLFQASDGAAITSYVWATGDVKIALAGGTMADATVANIVEKGRGKYALRLTSGESGTTGGIYLDLNVASINSGDCLPHSWSDNVVDLALATTVVDANVTKWLGGTPAALSSGNVPTDVKLWLTAAPAALSASGYIQAMLLRWLTDNGAGTPLALASNRVQAVADVVSMQANVLTANALASDAATEIANAVIAATATTPVDANVTGWLGTTPAALSSSGFLQVLLRAWLTDDAAGTPNPLISGRVDAAASVAAVLDALLSDHSIPGSVADGIAVAAALLQGNFYMDNTVQSPLGQTYARIRCFRTGAATGLASYGGTGEGEFATFVLTTEYVTKNVVKSHRAVRQ